MGAEQQSHLARAQSLLHELVKGGREEQTGEELFAVSDLLESNKNLLRALTDAGRAPKDRLELARSVFNGSIGSVTQRLVDELVLAHWGHSEELPQTLSLLALDAFVLADIADGRPELSQELVDAYTLITANRDLRIQLSEIGLGDADQRAELARQVFGNHVSPTALRLITRAAKRASLGHLVGLLRSMAERASELGGRLLVICTTARPLNDQQVKRMERLCSHKWGKQVDMAQVVDLSIIGGFRLDVGSEAIDTTIRSDIANARLALVR